MIKYIFIRMKKGTKEKYVIYPDHHYFLDFFSVSS